MARTSDRTSARNRARQALAEKQKQRRERDERMEAAATRYFAAADAIEKAQHEAAGAIKALIDEGEARGEIADLLGIGTRDIKTALDTLNNSDDDQNSDDAASAPEHESASHTTDENSDVA